LSGTGVKKHTSDHINNRPAFSKEIECIYNALAGDTGMDNNRDIFLERGMKEWLCVFNIKPLSQIISRQVFRM